MKRLLLLLFPLLLYAVDYRLGHGYEIAPWLKAGGYISTEYAKFNSGENAFEVDDLAFLGYGDLTESLSYLIELEAVKYYVRDFQNDTSESNTRFYVERAYATYAHSQSLSLTAGKFITPGSYGNQTPINILRDTTSKPMLSQFLFPRLVSGAMIEGYLPGSESTRYALFVQKNRDIDHGYNNFYTKDHVGALIKKEMEGWEAALWGGAFEDVDLTKNLYLGLSLQYKDPLNTLLLEGAAAETTQVNESMEKERQSFYAQYCRQLNRQHYLVGRYEYFKDETIDQEDNIFILGYNYRPIFPVSFKAEYQHHDTNTDEKGVLLSFSILF